MRPLLTIRDGERRGEGKGPVPTPKFRTASRRIAGVKEAIFFPKDRERAAGTALSLLVALGLIIIAGSFAMVRHTIIGRP